MNLLALTPAGLYCEQGDFYVDPWRPVDRAIVTHAHSDHARWGMKQYLVPASGLPIFRTRLGAQADLQPLEYGNPITLGEVEVSFHPAGHILGSAQVRIAHKGEIWLVSGDYKTAPDVTCAPFELVRCHTFITESTFGLPIYRWRAQEAVFEEVNAWWRQNQQEGRTSVLFGYALGKAQRLLAGVDPAIGPIFVHGAVYRINQDYLQQGVPLPEVRRVSEAPPKFDWSQALIVAPPSANGTPWLRRFGDVSTAFASGWMQMRGARRRRAIDRGFVVSDHVDWPALTDTIRATGAERVWVTHGAVGPLVRWLSEQGYEASAIPTQFEGETDEAIEDIPEEALEERPVPAAEAD